MNEFKNLSFSTVLVVGGVVLVAIAGGVFAESGALAMLLLSVGLFVIAAVHEAQKPGSGRY